MKNEHIIFVVSSPSGGGKTTLTRETVKRVPEIKHSVSFTTRAPHEDEKDGKDYHFISPEKFEEMIRNGEMLEWAEIYGHRYGTSRSSLEMILEEGNDAILTIDTQGAAQLRARGVKAVFVFLMPPSAGVLAERLHKRERDTEEMIRRRLAFARHEFRQIHQYDYIVINDSFNKALEYLIAIIKAERCKKDRVFSLIEKSWRELIQEQNDEL